MFSFALTLVLVTTLEFLQRSPGVPLAVTELPYIWQCLHNSGSNAIWHIQWHDANNLSDVCKGGILKMTLRVAFFPLTSIMQKSRLTIYYLQLCLLLTQVPPQPPLHRSAGALFAALQLIYMQNFNCKFCFSCCMSLINLIWKYFSTGFYCFHICGTPCTIP